MIRTRKHKINGRSVTKTGKAGIGAAVVLSAISAAHAQQVIAPPPQYATIPVVLQPYQTNATTVFAPADVTAALQRDQAPPISLGPVDLRPNVFYRFLYGTGIATAGSNHVDTVIQDFSPGFQLSLGDHLTLDYTSIMMFYSSKDFRNTFDNAVKLAFGTTYENWVFGLSQSYASSSTPLVETGTQTDQQTYITAATATYRFNSEMWADLSFNQTINDADQFASHREWSTLDYLNYDFYDRLTVGVGLGFGYVNTIDGVNNTYQQIQGRAAWRMTDKVSFLAHAGLETREFLGSSTNSSTLVSPVAGGTIQWQPFEATKFSFDVSHAVVPSYFQNQVTETTDVTGGLNQRLFGVLTLDLSGGYHRADYIASDASTTARTDNYYTFNSRLSCAFLKHGTAGVFYQYSDNSSTAPGFTFTSNQVGFDLGFTF
jgi:hypothetical protein